MQVDHDVSAAAAAMPVAHHGSAAASSDDGLRAAMSRALVAQDEAREPPLRRRMTEADRQESLRLRAAAADGDDDDDDDEKVPARGGRCTIPALGGDGMMSSGQGYFIPDRYGGDVIYATSAPAASVQARGLRAVRYNERDYVPYVSQSQAPTGKFVKDCLHTAEEINANAALPPSGVQSRIAGTGVQFGDSDAANIAAAVKHAADAAASPDVGQAFVIVNTKWPGGATSPYHAAAVVARDGDTHITLEVFASASDGRRTVQNATYRMYSPENTFHDHWTREYFASDVRTVVVEPVGAHAVARGARSAAAAADDDDDE